MISSIFGKTKPINYIIVLSFVFVLYWSVNFWLLEELFTPKEFLVKTLALGALIFSFFVINFIVKRNKITEANSFAILFFAVLMVIFPEVLGDKNAILCNLFLLLALRRLISLKSLKNIKLKIFDATLWIMAASIFYDMALFFLLLVYIAIYFYEPKNIRNWMVPVAGVFTASMMLCGVLILMAKESFLLEHYTFTIALDKAYFLDWKNSVKLLLFVLVVFMGSIYTFVRTGKTGQGKLVIMRLIMIFFVMGILLKVIKNPSGMYPVIITFFPAVVFFTNYVETIKKPNTKEVVLIASILIPFIIFLSGLAIG